MMLVKAGKAVDDFIDKLVPLLEKGDIIIDGGNSEYQGGTPKLEVVFWTWTVPNSLWFCLTEGWQNLLITYTR